LAMHEMGHRKVEPIDKPAARTGRKRKVSDSE
jgi:hypothetical protein